ncbi:dehydrogenase E1 component subunit alpha/beta [Candidatus Halocynthiibacter alkanivorans]|uniref:dehydrogenase E1 component subunit alpha/beta n=1 Tax=Candidatus Halocynthiibacter alkanivorans TaxID=2267619 RepID=UPI000DF3DB75|nr:alpha-ketoacid dehydrogenase subunit alpha/beta [Candidatus Halocynthiibacter alkanivorans]
MDRAEIVHQNFLNRVSAGNLPVSDGAPSLAASGMSREKLVSLFQSQLLSRHLDRHSRKLQARGQGFYTIGSSGHEGNGAVALAMRVTDPAFLHYRGATFQIARASQVPGQTPLWDMLLSFTSSSDDPISGGRHKVLGSKALNIPPQTSTIASHLPKAVGAAYSMGLAARRPPEHLEWPCDSIAMCSFGDASLNHSTAQGAINTAGWTAWQNVPLPLMFVCEDNGIGISTKSPGGWVAANLANRPGLQYFRADGLDPVACYTAAKEAADWIRTQRKPAVLHMNCVRLYGHAGPDVQTAYMSREEVEATEAHDPLLYSARRVMADAGLSTEDVLRLYNDTDARTARAAEQAITRPRLQNADQIMAAIVPPKRECVPTNGPSEELRAATFGAPDMRAMKEPQHMAKLLNMAMTDLMLAHEDIVMAGEDVGNKGGVYGVTQRLQQRFGQDRMIDTLLDEQSILGLAIGLGQNGFLPMPEIQFLAYLHNAEDQIRGEAATLSFFSDGQYTNPMVLRIAGLGYQRGFGGHFHNDNSLAVLRDIPGIILAVPSNGYDAVLMLREAVCLAREEQRIVVFVEPIALYMTRDLHEAGDNGWCFDYPLSGSDSIPLGQIGVHGNGKDVAIVTYGNGAYLSRKAQKTLAAQGINIRIIDMRWLSPLPEDAIISACKGAQNILVVDECRHTGSQSEALMALFTEQSSQPVSRITAKDSFIATGPAYGATLPSVDEIVERVQYIIRNTGGRS